MKAQVVNKLPFINRRDRRTPLQQIYAKTPRLGNLIPGKNKNKEVHISTFDNIEVE